MSKKRKQYSSEFKAKVALAAIRGEETVPQLAARHGIHPTQINSWKRQLIEQAAEYFPKIKVLERQIQALRMICIASSGN